MELLNDDYYLIDPSDTEPARCEEHDCKEPCNWCRQEERD